MCVLQSSSGRSMPCGFLFCVFVLTEIAIQRSQCQLCELLPTVVCEWPCSALCLQALTGDRVKDGNFVGHQTPLVENLCSPVEEAWGYGNVRIPSFNCYIHPLLLDYSRHKSC